jgi:hypothetical protein
MSSTGDECENFLGSRQQQQRRWRLFSFVNLFAAYLAAITFVHLRSPLRCIRANRAREIFPRHRTATANYFLPSGASRLMSFVLFIALARHAISRADELLIAPCE